MNTAVSSNAIGPVTANIDSCCLSASELEAEWSAGSSGEAGREAHHVVLQDETTGDCGAFGQLGKLNYELRQKEVSEDIAAASKRAQMQPASRHCPLVGHIGPKLTRAESMPGHDICNVSITRLPSPALAAA